MADLVLYHASPSRSAVTLWMLEEVGQPYDVELLSLQNGDNRKPEFLAINPMGKVPALRHRDAIVTESAAICTYLADEFPQARLNVPVGDPRRGEYLKWLFFGPSCVEPAILERAYPRKEAAPRSAAGFGDYDTVVDVLAKAAAAADPWLLGKQFTAADVIIGSGIRWGTLFKLLPERPEFAGYLSRIAQRPAAKAAEEKDARLGQRKS
ncbi:MAG: glutathione S-transferase family protein [Hyphomicrobiaceae bacterium]